MVSEGIEIVTVVVDVTKMVAGMPLLVTVVSEPYSKDVVYGVTEIVDGDRNELVGKINRQVDGQLTVGLVKI